MDGTDDERFQYPHRIVGGFKPSISVPRPTWPLVSVSSSDRRGVQAPAYAPATAVMPCFSILIGSSGGSRRQRPEPHPDPGCFSILIGSSGGSSAPHFLIRIPSRGFSILIGSSGGSSLFLTPDGHVYIMFQYPHRIVGGFKLWCGKRPVLRDRVSVSSSDRRGVQAYTHHAKPHAIFVSVSSSDRRGVQVDPLFVEQWTAAKFQYPHRIVGGFKLPIREGLSFPRACFSILIGSSGGSSMDRCGDICRYTWFQYPHRIVGGFK